MRKPSLAMSPIFDAVCLSSPFLIKKSVADCAALLAALPSMILFAIRNGTLEMRPEVTDLSPAAVRTVACRPS